MITGHSGFIGSWLSVLLQSSGTRVIGYSQSDDASSNERSDWLKRLHVTDVRGDVRDLRRLLAAADEYRPDLLVHLAAQPLLGRGFSEPHLTFDTNINGSLAVLEAIRIGAIPALIHVTSDKCYAPPPLNGQALDESSPIGGAGPYSASKSIAETLFHEFSTLVPDGSAMASVRLGNVIGGGDYADRLVPNALRSFERNEPFSIRDRTATRPFQHVLDVVVGLNRLSAALLGGQIPSGLAFNFAPPEQGIGVREVVAALALSWGPGAALGDMDQHTGFPEQQALYLDGRRAATMLNWRHQLDIMRSADWTVAWARLVAGGTDPAEATAGQVAQYLTMFGNK